MGENTQERMVDMINKFGKLAYEDQIFLSGLVQGMYLQKEKQIAPPLLAKKNRKQTHQS